MASVRAGGRLRVGQFDEVSYPVYFPPHAVPESLRGNPDIPGPDAITPHKYATSVDERNFLTVYEYAIRENFVIWDYYTGYVHLTGLWKAAGNSKADIVKLLDSCPELEPVLRRVRGGFLKIQGTWVPYDVARRLALRVCWPIRFSLIPLFGATFPQECLKPHQLGFGQLQLRRQSDSATVIYRKQPLPRLRTMSGPSTVAPYVPMATNWNHPNESVVIEEELPRLTLASETSSPSEVLQMLQATKSLQKLAGFDQQGGLDIECSGRVFRWDGNSKLHLLEPKPVAVPIAPPISPPAPPISPPPHSLSFSHLPPVSQNVRLPPLSSLIAGQPAVFTPRSYPY